MVAVLEEVDKVNDIGVLAHFEHFDLATLLENLDVRHVFLCYLLHCDFLVGLLVSS